MGLIKYNGSQFLFDRPAYKRECIIDYDFKPHLDIINDKAKKYGIFIYTTSSYRDGTKAIKGAVVVPAKKSNHDVAHAIDFNLLYKGEIYDNDRISKLAESDPNHPVIKFLRECDDDKIIRWGGEFKTRDDIHLDDGLNVTNPKLWEEKYKLLHTKP